MILRIAAVLTALLCVGALRAFAGDSGGGQTIHVSIVTCPDAVYFETSPKATLYSDANSATPIALSLNSEGFYGGTISVKPGHYSVYGVDGFCEGGVALTVLPSHDRDIGLVLREHGRPMYDVSSSLSGTLPIKVVRATLTMKDGGEIPLTLDGGAYYGEGLPERDYILNLYLNGDLLCEIPVKLQHGTNSLNVTALDVQHTVGYLTKYPGQPAVFHLLWGLHQIR